ncbi:hypothetical protein NEDG_00973 [Nematocida displodere]|uniref:Thioredoxin domain-containing protein n=1 Tax=Nematocida displodere TaxID=1805483 RepID=A0A177EA65_9MICR|nr:hypothetical protein NEDG_00973 [Nematocida displodere]
MDVGDSNILEEFAAKRMAELQKLRTLREIEDETLLLKKTKTDTMIVHFYQKAFKRCKEMNKALEEIAPKFPKIDFLLADAAMFPFITEKLEITELPYLATFTKGFFIGGIIGFQDIGETAVDLALLEQYIKQSDLSEKTPQKSAQ